MWNKGIGYNVVGLAILLVGGAVSAGAAAVVSLPSEVAGHFLTDPTVKNPSTTVFSHTFMSRFSTESGRAKVTLIVSVAPRQIRAIASGFCSFHSRLPNTVPFTNSWLPSLERVY